MKFNINDVIDVNVSLCASEINSGAGLLLLQPVSLFLDTVCMLRQSVDWTHTVDTAHRVVK